MGINKRIDGVRLKHLNHYQRIIPFVMPSRNDATVLYEANIDITHTLAFLKAFNQDNDTNASIMDVIMAAMVRMLSQRPHLNRFVVGKNMYARNQIIGSFALKKEMSEQAETTEVKITFDPADTLLDSVSKIRSGIEENKGNDATNDQEGFTNLMNKLPNWLISMVIGLVKGLDRIGRMPKSIHALSPFHASFFLTNLGSLGIGSVYHHLYELGTVSWFVGLGNIKTDRKNETVKRTIDLKFVYDERLTDGYYAAKALRMLVKFIEHPEKLLVEPKSVITDECI